MFGRSYISAHLPLFGQIFSAIIFTALSTLLSCWGHPFSDFLQASSAERCNAESPFSAIASISPHFFGANLLQPSPLSLLPSLYSCGNSQNSVCPPSLNFIFAMHTHNFLSTLQAFPPTFQTNRTFVCMSAKTCWHGSWKEWGLQCAIDLFSRLTLSSFLSVFHCSLSAHTIFTCCSPLIRTVIIQPIMTPQMVLPWASNVHWKRKPNKKLPWLSLENVSLELHQRKCLQHLAICQVCGQQVISNSLFSTRLPVDLNDIPEIEHKKRRSRQTNLDSK